MACSDPEICDVVKITKSVHFYNIFVDLELTSSGFRKVTPKCEEGNACEVNLISEDINNICYCW